MGRSLRVSKTGLAKADKAFRLKGWTQEYLAGVAGCSRATVINFFAQRPIEKRLFQAFCTELGLKWAEIAELEADETPNQALGIDELINAVRDNMYGSIVEKCGSMRVLDMSQPIGLDDIYTTVNILEKITGRTRLEIAELLKQANPDNFERFSLSGIQEKRVPGLEAVNQHPKLMILGKPGAGKTTFLKHLAIQCVEGQFKPNLMPLFITLKDFAEAPGQPSLLNYVTGLFASYGLETITKEKTGTSTTFLGKPSAVVELFLNQGSVLVLLDGLDEVRETDNGRVLKQIQSFANQFHKNPFIITCRIAANEYTFEQFIEVEIADFDNQQIETFTTKWFQAKQDLPKAKTFMERLNQDKGIRELASSPILLTLLCLVFEESGTFPANRSELYKDGLDVLLKKWDAKRNIERDQSYKKLSLKRKEDLLSQIAIKTFEPGNYFFKQKEVEREINTYIRNLPDANTEEEALILDSEAVLKSIEAQHGLLVERARGIYSFSHLTFHEYFTAHKLVTSSQSDIFVTQLLPHITERRWQEVFLLTVGMVESADELLQTMKQQIDELVAEDDKIQQFLTWVQQKACSLNVSYRPTAVRAFYVALDLDFNLARLLDPDLGDGLDLDLDCTLDLEITLDPALSLKRDRDLVCALDRALSIDRAFSDARSLELDLDSRTYAATYAVELVTELEFDLAYVDDTLNPRFKKSFQGLRNQVNRKLLKWWEKNGAAWIAKFRAVMVQHCNIGHDWRLNPEQQKLLKQYYDANRLLVTCLNSDCDVRREVKQEIESGLLLPIRPCAPLGNR